MPFSTEQKIKQILSSSPAILYACRAENFKVTFVSDNITHQFGYSVRECMDDPTFWSSNLHPDDREQILAGQGRIFEDGQISQEYRFRKKDGTYLWVQDNVRLLCDEAGRPSEIIGSWLDISGRKSSEEERQASDALFKDFFANNPIPTIISSLEGIILEVNQAFLDGSGFKKEEVIGVRSSEVLWCDSDDRDVMVSAIMERGHIDNFESTFFDKAKNLRHCLLSSRVLTIHGEPKILSSLIDVTAKDRAEEKLRKSERLFRDFFSANPIATIISSPDGRIHMVNPAFTTTTGFSSSEVVGRTAQEMNFWRDLEDREHMVRAVREKGFIDNLEANFYGKNNLPMRCLISSRSIQHENETRILSTVTDVTEQRKGEEAVRKLERAKSDFISSVAHELRTPLIAVIGYCELLENSSEMNFSEEQTRKYLDIIMSNAEVLNRLVDDLLDMGRIQVGRSLGISPKDTDLAALVEKVVVSAKLKDQNHVIVVERDEGLPEKIWIDPGRIAQVLHNLLNNALKFSPDGGDVKIRLTVQGNSVEVTVIDQGIGLDDEAVEHIFDRFYRVDTEDKRTPGLGLGLSIVKQIVTDHGGDIKVKSAIGKGTAVTFSLPLKS